MRIKPIVKLVAFSFLVAAALCCGYLRPPRLPRPTPPVAIGFGPPTAPPPTSTPAPTSTVDPRQGFIVGRSPDGEWTAEAIGNRPPVSMRVSRADGSATWAVTYEGPVRRQAYLKPVHWSGDGRHLYFTIYIEPFELMLGGPLYVTGSGVQRLALDTGAVEEILAGEGQFQVFSVSRDSTRLAYVRSENDASWLVVRDLRDWEDHRWKLSNEPVQAGDITWSPDGSALVLLVTRGPTREREEFRTKAVLFDLGALRSKTIMPEHLGEYWRLEWLDDHTFYLEDPDIEFWYTDADVKAWMIDVRSGEIVPTRSLYGIPEG